MKMIIRYFPKPVKRLSDAVLDHIDPRTGKICGNVIISEEDEWNYMFECSHCGKIVRFRPKTMWDFERVRDCLINGEDVIIDSDINATDGAEAIILKGGVT